MIYQEPTEQTPGYHTFQVYDEPELDGTPPDPTVLMCCTRAELVAAIEAIDLHTNTVLPGEIDEDPAPRLGTFTATFRVACTPEEAAQWDAFFRALCFARACRTLTNVHVHDGATCRRCGAVLHRNTPTTNPAEAPANTATQGNTHND